LLVEDEAIVRDLVEKMLEEDGYEVIGAPDPVAAVELARSVPTICCSRTS
jgi:CheY-like chemotaxis protein